MLKIRFLEIYATIRDRNFGQTGTHRLTADDLYNAWPFHAVSLVVRASIFRQVPYDKLPYFVAADRFLLMWIGCFGDVHYEGDEAMGVYHRHDTGASANSVYYEVWDQNTNLLEFCQSFLNNRSVYDKAFKGYCRGYYVAYGRAPKEAKQVRNRFSDFVKYASRFSLKAWREDIYILLLILFGKSFYNLKN